MHRRLLTALVVTLTCLALRGDGAAAGAAPPLASELAAGAVVALEVQDLGGGLRRWREARLRRALERTAALATMRRSRIFRKLTARVARLEQILGFELTLDRLILAAGHRAALGLYDVSDTSFVIVAETTAAAADRSPLWRARGRMERREHGGVAYYLAPETPRRRGAALALVGDRLVFGNDLDAFRRTLLLAARGAGVATKAAPGPALADEPRYRQLLAAAPRDLFARVFVDQDAIQETSQFEKRWIFDRERSALVDAALLGVRFAAEETVEVRLYRYRAGAVPVPVRARAAGAAPGHTDVAPFLAALPAAPYAALRPTNAADAAARLTALCGGDAARDGAPLRALLDRAGPRALLEVADPAPRQGLRTYDRSGLLVRLATPGALDLPALERVLAAARLRGLEAGGVPPLAFADEGGARVLRLPLVDDLAVTVRRAGNGDALVVATDPAIAARLHDGYAAAAPLLTAPAPVVVRLDVRRAARHLGDVAALLAARGNWARADARFYSESVAGLPAAFPAVRDLVLLEQGLGDLRLVEVRYREGGGAP